MSQQITITQTTVIAADQVINYVYEGPNNGALYVQGTPTGTPPNLTNNGTIKVTDDVVGSWGVAGVRYAYDGGFWNGALFLNAGTISVVSTHGDGAVGAGAVGWSPQFRNTGHIVARAPEGSAVGLSATQVNPYAPGGVVPVVINSGDISVDGAAATGVVYQFGRMENTGAITVHAHTDDPNDQVAGVTAVQLDLLNTGSILVDNDRATDAIGVWIRPDSFNAPQNSRIENSGLISGDYAILEWAQANISTQVFNTGTLSGKIDLGGGDDVFVNSGRLNGTAQLGAGVDSYDGRLGSSSGAVDGGSGADILLSGAGADDLRGGGDEDVLAAGAGDDRLAGGAGADVFVMDASGGADVVTDFDAALDRFSLGGALFLSAVTSGSATVLTHAGGEVRVEGLTGLSLSGWNGLVIERVLLGTGGDDLLTGTADAERLFGGAGRDTASWAGVARGVMVDLLVTTAQETGGGGLDRLFSIENLTGSNHADALRGDWAGNLLRGLGGNDVVEGRGADDVLDGGLGDDVIDGGSGVDVVDYSQASAGVTIDLALQVQTTVMGTDTLYGVEAVLGSAFDDFLIGGRLQGGGGDDRLLGTNGDDLQMGDAGDDWLSGAGGTDELRGDDGADHLEGGGARDFLRGGAGDDVIVGGEGQDELTGGAGADTFVFQSVQESRFTPGNESPTGIQTLSDLITDFEAGVDLIDLSGLGGTSYTLTQGWDYPTLQVVTPTGLLEIRISGGMRITASDIIFSRAGGALAGTLAYDRLVGGAGDDVLWGQAGADSLTGGRGADVFRYTEVNDSTPSAYDIITDFQPGVDKIDLTALRPGYISMVHYQGATYLFTASTGEVMQIAAIGDVKATDVVTGEATNYYIVGDDNGLTLIGGANADTVVGGGGTDIVIGGDRGDALYGGAGADMFAYSAASQSNNQNLDIIHDFQTGVDKLDLSTLAASNVSIVHYNGGTFINGGTANGAFQIASINTIQGSDIMGLDWREGVYVVGENTPATLAGGFNSDTIVGGAADDLIFGGWSADALFGGGGADTFLMTHWYDSNPNGAVEIIHDFQTGVDKLDLTALSLTNVSIVHAQGGTFVFGNMSIGPFRVASIQDLNASDIVGLTGGVYIVSDDQSRTLIGGDLGDTLVGGAAGESLMGGAGADILIGGGGADALFGGAGADTFRFLAKGDSTPAASDIIHDFQTGVDKIDLTALHTNGANDHYSLISDATASYLFVQLAGNPANDLQILFASPNVQATDILW